MDTRRPPPGAPPPYGFVNRMYTRSLRPVVIATGALSALWTLLWAVSLFRDISIHNHDNFPDLATFSIVMGVMFMAACLIEIFGVVAATTQRLALIRIYALGSVLSCLLVVAASLMGVVIHFIHKDELIRECITEATGQEVDFRFGWFGPSVHDTLTPEEADSFCRDGYSHDSWSIIVSFLAELGLGVLFSAIAFGYYRQSLDPTSAANAFRAPPSQLRGGAYPQHYNPPYNSSVPNLGYGAGPSAYAPPMGPPPGFSGSGDDLGKPPVYEGKGYGSKFGAAKDESKEDPFADFEGTGTRDVTSRPRPGDHDEFHV